MFLRWNFTPEPSLNLKDSFANSGLSSAVVSQASVGCFLIKFSKDSLNTNSRWSKEEGQICSSFGSIISIPKI